MQGKRAANMQLEQDFAPWCNGSTAGFDPVGPSSNLGGVTFFFAML
jgi:hypothetical protein